MAPDRVYIAIFVLIVIAFALFCIVCWSLGFLLFGVKVMKKYLGWSKYSLLEVKAEIEPAGDGRAVATVHLEEAQTNRWCLVDVDIAAPPDDASSDQQLKLVATQLNFVLHRLRCSKLKVLKRSRITRGFRDRRLSKDENVSRSYALEGQCAFLEPDFDTIGNRK